MKQPDTEREQKPREVVAETGDAVPSAVLDAPAFARLVRGQTPRLIHFYVKRGATIPDAEELTSDAFITLWERRESIQPGKEVGFLLGIARNKLLNYRRTRSTAAGRELPLHAVESDAKEPVDTATPSDAAIEAEARDVTAAAMAHLNERQRRCLILRFFQCMTGAEAAREMGISRSSVATLEKRSLAKVRKYLENIP
jgi:RNA polymerase sigma-70 factor (ECF subfamily)